MSTFRRPPAPADVLMSDGTIAVIRPMTPADLPQVAELHRDVSDEASRLRFFSAGRGPALAYVEYLRSSSRTVALVAESGDRVVALGTGEPVGQDVEEVAFLVDEQHRGQGLGSLLLEHLAADARDRGVVRLVADVLVDNHLMLQVFLDAGFDVTNRSEDGVVHVELDPSETARFLTAADDREARSEARSLRALLHPRN